MAQPARLRHAIAHLARTRSPRAQGHVRVGPDVVSDPAFLVTRAMEDYVTWVDQSRIKRAVMRYNDQLDDYDLLGN